jgi:quercetin dioxygenase-like cupin family protein
MTLPEWPSSLHEMLPSCNHEIDYLDDTFRHSRRGSLIFTSLSQPQQSGSVAFTRLYKGSDGQTHAERTEARFVPRADGIGLSPQVKATGFFYVKLPAGHVQEWHPAPRRQYVIGVSGRAEIELADGERFHRNRAV